MNRKDIVDGLAMLLATAGADDAKAGKAIDTTQTTYWYRVGYYIERYNLDPDAAMSRVSLELPLG